MSPPIGRDRIRGRSAQVPNALGQVAVDRNGVGPYDLEERLVDLVGDLHHVEASCDVMQPTLTGGHLPGQGDAWLAPRHLRRKVEKVSGRWRAARSAAGIWAIIGLPVALGGRISMEVLLMAASIPTQVPQPAASVGVRF